MAARYVQIVDALGRGISKPPLYTDVGDAVDEKGPAAWQAEVPEVLRTLLSTNGSQLQYVYRPEEPNEAVRLEGLARRLRVLASNVSSRVSLDQGLEFLDANPDSWLTFWTRELHLVPDADWSYFETWPDDARRSARMAFAVERGPYMTLC